MVPAVAGHGAVADELAMPSPLEWVEAPVTDRIAMLRRGVPSAWLRRLEATTALSRQALCELLGLKVSTLNRKLHNRAPLSPDESERLMGLHRLLGQVESVVRDCGDGQPFAAGPWLVGWLQRPNPSLGGATPGSYMDTAEGREQLGRLIGAQRSGAYM